MDFSAFRCTFQRTFRYVTETFRYVLVFLVICPYIISLGCAPSLHNRGADFPLHYTQKGIASWYGADFHGRKTANGEVYDMYKNTAAHRYLPLGSYVRVVNLKNRKSVVVKVNDRGPFVKGRILDLSYGAARALGMAEDGLAQVKIEIIQLPKQVSKGLFIQIGSFGYQANAARLQEQLSPYYQTHITTCRKPGSSKLYRIRVGPFKRISSAQKTLRDLENRGYPDSFIVAE